MGQIGHRANTTGQPRDSPHPTSGCSQIFLPPQRHQQHHKSSFTRTHQVPEAPHVMATSLCRGAQPGLGCCCQGTGAGGGHICIPSPAAVLPLTQRAEPRCTHLHQNRLQPCLARAVGKDRCSLLVFKFLVVLYAPRKPLKMHLCASTIISCSGQALHYTGGSTPAAG